ncbi:hypothetical protein TRIUR3_33666 [Triticum urartu]|uniref:Uncharacterized protein n=1 Tax=Triticum urartu TaxID=4572 RepID=M8AJC6_TRIUA|nr:hypothetical protein TRIUR3_33666 [Triticum urartu]
MELQRQRREKDKISARQEMRRREVEAPALGDFEREHHSPDLARLPHRLRSDLYLDGRRVCSHDAPICCRPLCSFADVAEAKDGDGRTGGGGGGNSWKGVNSKKLSHYGSLGI